MARSERGKDPPRETTHDGGLAMNPKPMRLAIAGIHIESSTFSPLFSRKCDFLATRGAEMMERYPFLAESDFAHITPLPLAHFRAIPGGRIVRDDYEAMKAEILDRLNAAGNIDLFRGGWNTL